MGLRVSLTSILPSVVIRSQPLGPLHGGRFRKRQPANVDVGNRMAFEPDIIITTPDGRIMVIEAKVAMNDLPRTEEALKRYMVAMQYPFGLLITPEKGWVYRDSYASLSPASVQRVEEFDSTQIWRQNPP